MTATAKDLYELLRKIRYDATAIQAKITDAFLILGELNIADREPLTCPVPECRLPMRGPLTLAEHMHVSHGAGVPAHWLHAETISDEQEAVA